MISLENSFLLQCFFRGFDSTLNFQGGGGGGGEQEHIRV